MAAKTRLTISAIALAATCGGALAAGSAYTTQDYQKCPIVKDEQATITRRCKGYGGVQLNWYGSDDDTTVDFGKNGLVGDGAGLSFAVAGNTVEWRGPAVRGKVKPAAAIVRYSICQNIGGDNCRSALYVYKLDGTKSSCVMAAVDGRKKDANLVARLMVDQRAAGFKCGKDEQIEP